MSLSRRALAPMLAGTWVAIGGCGFRRSVVPPPNHIEFERPKLDAHLHLYSRELIKRTRKRSKWRFPVRSREDALRLLVRNGVQAGFALSGAYLYGTPLAQLANSEHEEFSLVRTENDFVLQAGHSSEKLTSFVSVNPLRTYSFEEISRCYKAGASGLKLHFWNSDINIRKASHLRELQKVVRMTTSYDRPLIVHACHGGLDPLPTEADIETLVERLILPYPKLRICFAHAAGYGGFGPSAFAYFSALTAATEKNKSLADRVWIDLAGVFITRDRGPSVSPRGEAAVRLQALLAKWRPDRMFWGSDNEKNSLANTYKMWPLGADAWSALAANSATDFLGG